MKLKYYLRGMGIGIVLTAIVMGFALGGRKKAISDAEVIERAKALGMVEANTGVLAQPSEDGINKDDGSNAITPDTTLDQSGAEVSEEVNKEVALSDKPVSDLPKEEKKGKDKKEEDKSVLGESKEASDSKESVNESEGTSEVSAQSSLEEIKEPVTEAANTASTDSTQAIVQENTDAAALAATETPKEPETTFTGGYTTTVAKTVTIPGGISSDSVAAILYREGVVDNAVTFNKYLIDRRMDRIIRSGVKTIPAGSGYEDIANIICK